MARAAPTVGNIQCLKSLYCEREMLKPVEFSAHVSPTFSFLKKIFYTVPEETSRESHPQEHKGTELQVRGGGGGSVLSGESSSRDMKTHLEPEL